MKNIPVAVALFLCALPPAHAGLFSDDVPVKVEFRKALLDSSLVGQFRNTTTDKYLVVVVTLRNKTTNEVKSGLLKIGPNETNEIGWAQGWSFVSGETIKIEHSDYSSVKVKVP
jgi:hypothetical protein